MKKLSYVFVILPIMVLFFSCEKEKVNQNEVDEQIILEYLDTHNLQAVKHASGLYYTIIQQGYGAFPNAYSTIQVQYKGYLTDGTVFDQTTGGKTATINLGNVVSGWRIGFPLLREGGKARFFIPSTLGYGKEKVGEIPKNSVLIFDVVLVEVY